MTAFPSFLKPNNIPLYIPLYIYTPVFLCSSVDIHLGCFHIFANEKNGTMNKDVQISLQDSAVNSFGFVPRNGLSGSYSSSVFNILKNL